MSSHVMLTLHAPEETVDCDFLAVLMPYPRAETIENPISMYFSATSGLIKKIIDTKYAEDAEVLGLLVLGVLSSAELYFRMILGELAQLCPLCGQYAEAQTIPVGANDFYASSGFPSVMSAFEHESLADSRKIASEIKRFSGFVCLDSESVRRALEDFALLCELRHCFVHSRGFAGLKAIRALGGKRSLHKILIKQQQALDFIKLSHNAVRAVNHYLGNEVINRWIDKDVLVGRWTDDKKLFNRYWRVFTKQGEDSYLGSPQKAYAVLKPIIRKRRQAFAAKVATS